MNEAAVMKALVNSQRSPGFVRALFLALSVCLLLAIALASLLGAHPYSVREIVEDTQIRQIVVGLRMPRVLFAVIVGGALSVIGAAYQALFRNPLASPFSLGVSSGAALGAALAIFAGSSAAMSVEASAIVAAAASIAIILLLSRSRAAMGQDSLLLVGVVFSFFCSSILTLLQYLSDYSQLFRVSRWMLGGVPAATWTNVAVGAVLSAGTLLWLWRHHRSLDLMLFGDDFAAVKGVDVKRLSNRSFVLTSVVVGWLVAQCGVIGFVGIIVPAAVRLLVGLHHRRVLPLSFLSGALLVVVCDLLGRVATPPFEIPAGVFSAVLGGPIFLLLLLKTRQQLL